MIVTLMMAMAVLRIVKLNSVAMAQYNNAGIPSVIIMVTLVTGVIIMIIILTIAITLVRSGTITASLSTPTTTSTTNMIISTTD